jgi:hypothetical protein
MSLLVHCSCAIKGGGGSTITNEIRHRPSHDLTTANLRILHDFSNLQSFKAEPFTSVWSVWAGHSPLCHLEALDFAARSLPLASSFPLFPFFRFHSLTIHCESSVDGILNNAVKKFLQFQTTVDITAVILNFVLAVPSTNRNLSLLLLAAGTARNASNSK